MSSLAFSSRIWELFRVWSQTVESAKKWQQFTRVFAAIWLIYDLADLYWGGTRSSFWFYQDRSVVQWITACQVGLVLCEVSLFIGFKTGGALLFAFLLRGIEAYFFPLNDFLYYCLTTLIMAHSVRGKRWVKDVLWLDTGWIYLATATLKLNPQWLSGGELYSRQMLHFSTHAWPYPAGRCCISQLMLGLIQQAIRLL